MREMTEQQGLRMLALIYELWEIAKPIGSLHAYWDVIIDMQNFVGGKPTIISKTADEWIIYAENLLQGRII